MKQTKTPLAAAFVGEMLLQTATLFLFVGLSRFERGWQWFPVALFVVGSVCLLYFVRIRLSFRAAFVFCFLASTGFAVVLEVLRRTLYPGFGHDIEPLSAAHVVAFLEPFATAMAAAMATLLGMEALFRAASRRRTGGGA